MWSSQVLFAYCVSLASAGLVLPRTVASLNQAATEEAQQRDATATRAFSNVQIKTSDGRCLFVDKLSGDFRANLTPIQVAACGSTDGQGWDVITAGKHINVAGAMLVVNTLTQACMNFDPRRAAGNQVLLFSCGGRADGGGQVTTSQLFAFGGGAGPLSLQPQNEKASCFAVQGNALDIATCVAGDASQSFTFGTAASGSAGGSGATTAEATTAAAPSAARSTGVVELTSSSSTNCNTPRVVTITVTASPAGQNNAVESSTASSAPAQSTAGSEASQGVGGNPSTPVPVSRAGGTLNPSAAAESQQRDASATRAFTGASIKAPNGQCLSVDPTAGDFRQNLIPVGLVTCSGSANEKWDVITAGKHNDKAGSALIVSTLMNGCVSLDGRRAQGDTVTMFSCGGRADGNGGTNAGQLVPFTGGTSFSFAPEAEDNRTCVVPGNGRLVSAPCSGIGQDVYTIVA